MKKMIMCFFASVFICVNSVCCFGADVKYYYFAEKLWNLGLFLGSDGSFDLDRPMTRAEAAVMVTRLLGKEEEAAQNVKPLPFNDVPAWAAPYVSYLYGNGITYGISDAAYGSGDPVSAPQYITFVLRVLGYKDGQDFSWENAAQFAFDIGLIGKPCLDYYAAGSAFLRDNAALVSYSALYLENNKNGGLLIDNIATKKPEGAVPAATRE